MTDRRHLPRLDDLPIPVEVTMGTGWTPHMVEMADHIGPRAVLQLADRLGGELVRVPARPTAKLTDVIGAEKAAIMSHVYRHEMLRIPSARTALRVARRAGVIAAVRARDLTGNDAARILRTSRSYLAKLVNRTDEAADARPLLRLSPDRPRQLELLDDV